MMPGDDPFTGCNHPCTLSGKPGSTPDRAARGHPCAPVPARCKEFPMSKIVSAVEKFLSAQPHWSWEG